MSNIDNTTLPTDIGISESQYKEFMREIKAMKPNKRKNWKNYLTDKYGTRTRCKYRNGKIYNWSLTVRLSRQHRYFILFTLSTFRPTNSHATFTGSLAVLGPALLRISARTERFSHSHSVLSEKYHLVQYLLVFHTLKLFDHGGFKTQGRPRRRR